MLNSEETTIQGTGYQVTQLPYKKGQQLLIRLYKVLGPSLAEALAQAPEIPPDATLADIDVGKVMPSIAAAVSGLADNLSESDFDYMVDTLAGYTKISTEDGKWPQLKSVMEFHFSGNYGEMFQWLWFALRVNFLGFSGGRDKLGDLLTMLAARAPTKAKPSQNTSTGEHTE